MTIALQEQAKTRKTKRTKQDILDALFVFYGGDIPGYVVDAGKNYIKIRAGEEVLNNLRVYKITIEDVARYYAYQADNIVSGCRKIADLVDDWRYIDYIAQECLEWFKFINIEKLRKTCIRYGLIPRF